MQDYQRTVLFYCREFICEAEVVRGLSMDHQKAMHLIEEMLKRDEFNEEIFHEIIAYLNRSVSGLLSLYSRNPQDLRLDSLYRRAGSIRDMCVNLISPLPEKNEKEISS